MANSNRRTTAFTGAWESKEAEDRQYAIPNGRLWRVYTAIDGGSRYLNRPNRADIKAQLTVQDVLNRHGIKAKRGSTYYMIPCPTKNHKEENLTRCVLWTSIKAWKCFGCEAHGDLVDLEAYYRGHRQ